MKIRRSGNLGERISQLHKIITTGQGGVVLMIIVNL